MIMNKILILLITFVLSGCINEKIDGSSNEVFKQSIIKIQKSLPAEDKVRFDKSLNYLLEHVYVYGDLDGMTAPQIFSLYTAKSEERNRLAHIRDLKKKEGEKLISEVERYREERRGKNHCQGVWLSGSKKGDFVKIISSEISNYKTKRPMFLVEHSSSSTGRIWTDASRIRFKSCI
jgi:PBP1b-binding outer membrane lipoprotein LpoB